jgi:hypothetical protein
MRENKKHVNNQKNERFDAKLQKAKKNPFQSFCMVPLKVLSPFGSELQASS